MPTIFKTNPDGTITATEVPHINAYLINGPDVFVESRKKPLCDVPIMIQGNRPIDDGNLILSVAERDELIKKCPQAEKYIRRFIGSEEFINNKMRYCLWLVDCSPAELRKMTPVYERVKNVKQFRLQSKRGATYKLADKSWLFAEIRQPDTDFIVVPAVSGESRKYIPMGFMTPDIIVSNLVSFIPDGNLYLFGLLNSVVHMAWMRIVAGRLGISYRYSGTLVYNNFPFINTDSKRRAKIESAAQAILDARAKYPDSSLADLYDENVMPVELRAAHRANDFAVMDAYGYPDSWYNDEEKIVVDLLYRYEALTKGGPKSRIAAISRRNF